LEDITPALLEKIQKEFNEKLKKDTSVIKIKNLIDLGKATYIDANNYAAEVGKILVSVFKTNISSSTLPDGRMYFNIAERILGATLGTNYKLISSVATEIQKNLNLASGLGIKAIASPLNKDRIKGFVDRIASETEFDKVAWILDQPIINYGQSVVDETIKANAEFHFKAGLSPTIVRTIESGACKWCKEVAGTYSYPNVPDDIYRRHDNCYCTVEYNPGDGKKQNVHSKRWR